MKTTYPSPAWDDPSSKPSPPTPFRRSYLSRDFSHRVPWAFVTWRVWERRDIPWKDMERVTGSPGLRLLFFVAMFFLGMFWELPMKLMENTKFKLKGWVLLYACCLVKLFSRPHTTDFPQKVAFWKGNGTHYSGKSRLLTYFNLARCDGDSMTYLILDVFSWWLCLQIRSRAIHHH